MCFMTKLDMNFKNLLHQGKFTFFHSISPLELIEGLSYV